MLLNATFADDRTVQTAQAAIRDVERIFDLDLSVADEVIATRNETAVNEIVEQGQDFLQEAFTANSWVADWFGFSERKGSRDDEDW